MEQTSDSEALRAGPRRDGAIGRPSWWTAAHVILLALPLLDLVTLFLLTARPWDGTASTVFALIVISHGLLGWWVFKSRVRGEASREAALVRRYRDLQSAIEDGDLVLHYQPEVSLEDQRVHAVEALVRWRQPDGQLTPPLDFIPFAEESGLIRPLGTWVLREACVQIARWRATMPQAAQIRMSVNVSAVQLDHPKFVAVVQSALRDAGLSPDDLILEVTESILVSDPRVFRVILRQLQDLGLRIALDDFGTGYASINYLRAFKFDFVKLDRSFVAPLETPHGDVDLVAGLVTLTRSLGASVIAEGVSRGELAYTCRSLGCNWAQGHYFAPAASAEEIEAMLRSQGQLHLVA